MSELNRGGEPVRMRTLPRVIPASITPCKTPGHPDCLGMGKLARYLAEAGCDGLFILGSTGEASLLGENIRRQLTVAAREGIADGFLFCGISGLGTEQTISFARNAGKDGADAVVAMAPYFLKMNQGQLKDYAWKIADKAPVPVVFYHHLRMPTAFEPETIAELAAHENIVAIKETSGSLERLERILQAVDDKGFAVYQGSEALLLDSLAQGAYGSMMALANAFPALIGAVTRSWLAGDYERACENQRRLTARWEIFKRPEVGASFSNFLQAISQPLRQRGILECNACMTASLDPGFFKWVGEFYEKCDGDLAVAAA